MDKISRQFNKEILDSLSIQELERMNFPGSFFDPEDGAVKGILGGDELVDLINDTLHIKRNEKTVSNFTP